jgi:hypothetical protein
LTLKLRNTDDTRSIASDRRLTPAGPARLARFMRKLNEDIAGLPLSADPPPAVIEAHKAYEAAAAWAQSSIAKYEAAVSAEQAAGAADVKKMAASVRAGKASPKLTAAAAGEAIQAALVGIQAAEQLLSEAHDHVVDAAYDAWATWRRSLIDDAAESHAAAFVAAQQAAAAIVEARAAYSAVSTLDVEILSRFPKVQAQVTAELHTGLPWYESTHSGAPLTTVSIPGAERKGKPMALDLAVVVAAVQEAVASSGAFAAADWTTPTDPEHDAMLATPLDPATPWVRARAMRETGTTCSVCLIAPASAALPMVIEGRWWTVCPKCYEANAAEQAATLAESEQRAKLDRKGYPDDPQAGAWKAEKAKQVAESAHATALGGPDVVGDANAAMIAKHRHSDD